MLAFVAIIVIFGLTQARGEKPLASRLPAPSRPLSKPEPASLLVLPNLHLTQEQSSAIQEIGAEWGSERAKMLTAMSGFQPRQGRADQIEGSLQGYSELSRAFDATRAMYWSRACLVLDKKQTAYLVGSSK